MKENIPDTNDLNSLTMSEASGEQINHNLPFDLPTQFPNSSSATEDCNNPPQMQNGDLAEADQSRLELEDEEEGAVGGVLNITDECNTNSNLGQVMFLHPSTSFTMANVFSCFCNFIGYLFSLLVYIKYIFNGFFKHK